MLMKRFGFSHKCNLLTDQSSVIVNTGSIKMSGRQKKSKGNEKE